MNRLETGALTMLTSKPFSRSTQMTTPETPAMLSGLLTDMFMHYCGGSIRHRYMQAIKEIYENMSREQDHYKRKHTPLDNNTMDVNDASASGKKSASDDESELEPVQPETSNPDNTSDRPGGSRGDRGGGGNMDGSDGGEGDDGDEEGDKNNEDDEESVPTARSDSDSSEASNSDDMVSEDDLQDKLYSFGDL